MICSLIKQLTCHGQYDSPELEALKSYQQKGHRPELRALEMVLLATIHRYSFVYLVIDALDECPAANSQRKILMESLSRIYRELPNGSMLLCTSRREPDIETSIGTWLCSPPPIAKALRHGIAMNLAESKAQVDCDIAIYIDSTLGSSEYSSWPQKLKTEAKAALMAGADGMYVFNSISHSAYHCMDPEILPHYLEYVWAYL